MSGSPSGGHYGPRYVQTAHPIWMVMDEQIRRIVTSLFLGLCIGLFWGGLYGWLNITANADILSGQALYWEEWEVASAMKFQQVKAILMGLSCWGGVSLAAYWHIGYWHIGRREPTEVTEKPKKKKKKK